MDVCGAVSEGVPSAKTGNRGEGAGLRGKGDELSLGYVALEWQRVAQVETVGRQWTPEPRA